VLQTPPNHLLQLNHCQDVQSQTAQLAQYNQVAQPQLHQSPQPQAKPLQPHIDVKEENTEFNQSTPEPLLQIHPAHQVQTVIEYACAVTDSAALYNIQPAQPHHIPTFNQ